MLATLGEFNWGLTSVVIGLDEGFTLSYFLSISLIIEKRFLGKVAAYLFLLRS